MGKAERGRGRGQALQRAQADHPLPAQLHEKFSLTAAETRVACLLAEGLSYGEIGDRLGVSYHTVHSHMKAIHQKMGVATNLRLLALIRELGGK